MKKRLIETITDLETCKLFCGLFNVFFFLSFIIFRIAIRGITIILLHRILAMVGCIIASMLMSLAITLLYCIEDLILYKEEMRQNKCDSKKRNHKKRNNKKKNEIKKKGSIKLRNL